MPLASKHRLYINHRETEDEKVRIFHHGHHEAHKLLVPAGGIIDDKLVKRLKLTQEMLDKAEAPLSREELDKLRNRSVNKAPATR